MSTPTSPANATQAAKTSARAGKRREDASPPPQQAKRRKDNAGGATQSEASAPEATEPEGDDANTTDGGITATTARIKRAQTTRLMSGEEKRKRFLAKYSGMTPEQILGTSPPTLDPRPHLGHVMYWDSRTPL